jgi:preprotein translocase subunit SecE
MDKIQKNLKRTNRTIIVIVIVLFAALILLLNLIL